MTCEAKGALAVESTPSRTLSICCSVGRRAGQFQAPQQKLSEPQTEKKPPDGRKTGTAEGARGERGKEDGCTGTDMEPCTDERLMAGETRSG